MRYNIAFENLAKGSEFTLFIQFLQFSAAIRVNVSRSKVIHKIGMCYKIGVMDK